MADKLYTYEGEAMEVIYSLKRCIHAAECVKGLPGVFDPQKKPWVNPDAATADELAAVIERCPTGALAYQRKDGGAREVPPAENTVALAADGPLFAHGDIEVVDSDQNVVTREARVALCRCGDSKIKPFCDGTHTKVGFKADATIPAPKVAEKEVEGSHLRVMAAQNGPLILEGPVTIEGGGDSCQGTRAALCRCGASENKPFCDGSHVGIGFEAR